MPKISVILTSFNHEKYIQEAIDSVLNQTFTDFELIIWDDASTDNSWNLINQYSDPRIKAFRNDEQKRGVWGINKAISEVATGEYIAIHHSDDVWVRDKLEKQLAFLEAHSDIGAVFTNALAITEDGSPLVDEKHFYFDIFDQPNRTRFEWLRFFFSNGNALCHPSVLIRKSCYEDCGLYRFGLAQVGDFDMWIRLCLKYEIHVLPEMLVRFRVRESEANASGNRPENRIRGLYEYYKLLRLYKSITNFDDLVKVFPASETYRCNNEGDTSFALAMIALEEKPFCFTPLLGLDILFEAISDPQRAATIKRLYNFDYISFIRLTAQYDVFSREELSNLWRMVTERDVLIASLNQTVESVVSGRSEQKAKVEQLQNMISGLTQGHGNQVLQLNSLITERDALIVDLGQTIESVVVDRNEQKAEIEQLQGMIDRLSREHGNQVTQLNSLIAERDDQLEKTRMELSALYESKSWRLTSPLRWLVRQCSRVGNRDVSERRVNLQINGSVLSMTENEVGKISGGNDSKFRILLVSYYCPTRAHAGGLRILDIYTLIRQQCPNVQIDLLTHHRPSIDWSLDDVHNIFHNVYLSSQEELTPDVLLALGGSSLHYDVIDLQFHQSGYQIDAFRRIGTKIIFTPMESQAKVAFINVRTSLVTTNRSNWRKMIASFHPAGEEVAFVRKVDEVVCVSSTDASFLRAVTFSRHIIGLDTGVSQFEFAEALNPSFVYTPAENRRCNVLYVAYFGSETNVLALRWYLDNVHPMVKNSVPDYVLTVVGRGDLSAFSHYQDSSIEFVGEVDAIAPYIKEARVGIAPALAGSGFRGKVNQYAILGVPSVVSPIAHKGLAYRDGENIFVAEKPGKFAEQCIRLLTDFELNDRMGQAARELCLATYSWQSKWPTISKIYNLGKEEMVHEAT